MTSPAHLVVLVTGANAGLGYYTARHLAVKGNCTVLVGSRSLAKATDAIAKMKTEEPSIPASALEPLEIDITNDAGIAAAADHVAKTHGRLDVLINNAGISGDATRPLRTNFNAIFDANVVGTAAVTEAFIPLLRKSTAPAPARRIVNVSSSVGSLAYAQVGRTVSPAYTAYSVSKAALNMLSLYTMHRLKEDKIAVVMTTPGYCGTALNKFQGHKDPADGAWNTVHAATMGSYEDMNGKFAEDLTDGKLDIVPF
jgi:NAD(P)-dependent dehydrogenase (short-subunit alcohol dehydrogenase family)